MIMILADLFEFIDYVCMHGPEKSKEKPFYKLIQNILTKSSEFKCGIPYFILFENEDFVDLIKYDYVKYNPVYDETLSCIVFNNIHDLFYGIREVLKKVHQEYPNEQDVKDNYEKIRIFLSIVESSLNMDELCDLLKTSKVR